MKWSTILATQALLVAAACTTDSAKTADTGIAMDTSAVLGQPVDAPVPMAAAPVAGGMMDPNAAGAADLATIPGLTADMATSLVAGRPYTSNVALESKLTSLSDQQRDSVFSRLWTKIDLNAATDAEILLIPGVGSRMLREFKEYRPYASMDQWRRDIGKYVDDAELARLERYVMLR